VETVPRKKKFALNAWNPLRQPLALLRLELKGERPAGGGCGYDRGRGVARHATRIQRARPSSKRALSPLRHNSLDEGWGYTSRH
jgi:hypothetical protein